MTAAPATRHDATTEADRLLEAGDVLAATRMFVDLLESDPQDSYAWFQVAAGLLALGLKQEAADALQAVGRVHVADGNLPMALVAQKTLAEADTGQGSKLLDLIVEAYADTGADSARPRHPTPPPLPGAPPTDRLPSSSTKDEIVAAARAALQRAADAHPASKAPSASAARWPLFSSLGPELFRELVKLLELRVFSAGAGIVAQGEPAQSMYILARGMLAVMRDDTRLGSLRSGALFGEMALLARTARQARVIAESRSLLFEVSAQGIEDLAKRAPQVGETLAAHCRRRLLDNLAKTSPLLRDLPPEAQRDLLERFTAAPLPSGTTIIEEGQPSEALYVVLTGEVEVFRKDGAEQLRVATLRPGDVFGEISLISRRPATATVKTSSSHVVTLRLGRSDFDVVAQKQPQLLGDLYRLGSEREAEADSLVRRAEIPVGDDALL